MTDQNSPTFEPGKNVQTAGQDFIAAVHAKMSAIVAEFAAGAINRTQFHHVYDRYQRQIMTVTQMIAESESEAWRDAVADSEDTYHIRKRLTARAMGMSIYDNESSDPIETLGEFTVNTAQIAPMLRSYRSAAAEQFHAGMRSTELDDGHWLCFVPGRYTTLIALFSMEPSENQLNTVNRMHKDFEAANDAALSTHHADPDALAYTFLSFLKKARNSGDDLIQTTIGKL